MSEIENTVVLMLGGNMGDTRKYFSEALEMTGMLVGSVESLSSLYVSAPWGMSSQPKFLNQAVKLKTFSSHTEVFNNTRFIEHQLGKKSTIPNGPRTIDIDILFFNNLIINTVELTLPHPRMHLRRFNLEPLNEIMADFIHPVFNENIETLLKKCTDPLSVSRLD